MEADNIEILFIDYEVFESKIEIKKFLNISEKDFLVNFPIRKTRLS